MDAPLHIWVNYFGSHGHNVSGANRIVISVLHDEETRHGPVRILMRDGQRLREPELIDSPEGWSRRTTAKQEVDR